MRLSRPLAALFITFSIPAAYAWGAAGHEIIATIAQMYLHPSILPTICDILNFSEDETQPEQPCHLAPISTWADKLRFKMRWSAALHYVGSLDDHPSQTCLFPGERGWAGTRGGNVLDAIKNVTGLLEDWTRGEAGDATANEALKFLVHFMGDLHMPLHLTGRDRGGNSDRVLWSGRQTNLHSLWDGLLIAKAIRTVPRNYSRPLPYPDVEHALRGTIYDSYIRRIMWEGVFQKWKDDVPEWFSCPETTPPPPARGWQQVVMSLKRLAGKQGVEIGPDTDVLCPYHWAKPIHALNCDIVWPKELDEPPYGGGGSKFADEDVAGRPPKPHPPLLELDTPKYAGVIEDTMVVEKLLAQGGIRLAGILNYLFLEEAADRKSVV